MLLSRFLTEITSNLQRVTDNNKQFLPTLLERLASSQNLAHDLPYTEFEGWLLVVRVPSLTVGGVPRRLLSVELDPYLSVSYLRWTQC